MAAPPNMTPPAIVQMMDGALPAGQTASVPGQQNILGHLGNYEFSAMPGELREALGVANRPELQPVIESQIERHAKDMNEVTARLNADLKSHTPELPGSYSGEDELRFKIVADAPCERVVCAIYRVGHISQLKPGFIQALQEANEGRPVSGVLSQLQAALAKPAPAGSPFTIPAGTVLELPSTLDSLKFHLAQMESVSKVLGSILRDDSLSTQQRKFLEDKMDAAQAHRAQNTLDILEGSWFRDANDILFKASLGELPPFPSDNQGSIERPDSRKSEVDALLRRAKFSPKQEAERRRELQEAAAQLNVAHAFGSFTAAELAASAGKYQDSILHASAALTFARDLLKSPDCDASFRKNWPEYEGKIKRELLSAFPDAYALDWKGDYQSLAGAVGRSFSGYQREMVLATCAQRKANQHELDSYGRAGASAEADIGLERSRALSHYRGVLKELGLEGFLNGPIGGAPAIPASIRTASEARQSAHKAAGELLIDALKSKRADERDRLVRLKTALIEAARDEIEAQAYSQQLAFLAARHGFALPAAAPSASQPSSPHAAAYREESAPQKQSEVERLEKFINGLRAQSRPESLSPEVSRSLDAQLDDARHALKSSIIKELYHAKTPQEKRAWYGRLESLNAEDCTESLKLLSALEKDREKLEQDLKMAEGQSRYVKPLAEKVFRGRLAVLDRRLHEQRLMIIAGGVDQAALALEAKDPELNMRARSLIDTLKVIGGNDSSIQKALDQKISSKEPGTALAGCYEFLNAAVSDDFLKSLGWMIGFGLAGAGSAWLLRRSPGAGFLAASCTTLAAIKARCLLGGYDPVATAFQTGLTDIGVGRSLMNLFFAGMDVWFIAPLAKAIPQLVGGPGIQRNPVIQAVPDLARRIRSLPAWAAAETGTMLSMASHFIDPRHLGFWLLAPPIGVETFWLLTSGVSWAVKSESLGGLGQQLVPILALGVLYERIKHKLGGRPQNTGEKP